MTELKKYMKYKKLVSMKNFINIILSGLFLLCSLHLKAGQIQPITGVLKTTTTNIVTVGDSTAEVEIEQTLPTSGIADYNVLNLVTLYFDNNNTAFFSSTQTVTTTIAISRWDSAGVAMTNDTVVLTVNTSNAYNKQTVSKAMYKLYNGYKVNIEIIEVLINGVSSSTLPDYVGVESEIQMKRYIQFAGAAPTINSIDTLDTDCDSSGILDELKVNWGNLTGAEEYQVELIFVNNYGIDSTSSIPADSLNANFKNNSTRITTAFNSYKVTLAYERGYIAFRVRGLGRDYLNPDKYVYGSWSSPDLCSISSISANAKYYNWSEHEKEKNWQYSATFAEEGKKKEVVSYFDGSLHNRQSVTKVNSDNNVIVGETLYDFQGRPAVNVLPTPVVFPSCDTNHASPALKYYYQYNRDTLGNSYSKDDFDKDFSGTCAVSAMPMDTISGSSQYYSGNNPDKSFQQAFVPDAERFPFSQVEYTPDNTGRIRGQSGVGKTFQLGSKHETRYIYSQPNQIQLDRLFGSEAGVAVHYKKNTVIDANGQISVSYLNQEGKTVATSLAGSAPLDTVGGPAITEALPSGDSAAVEFTIDAFNKDANGNSLTNKITALDDGIEFSALISVSYAGNYHFDYDITVDTLYDNCLEGYCISCIYDLTIKVIDECGTDITALGTSDTLPINKRIGHLVPAPNGFTMSCDSLSEISTAHDISLDLSPGAYTVSKVLKINKDARDFYVNNYFDTTYNACIKTKEEFIEDALATIDTSDCYITCNTCVAALGTKDDYVSSGKGTAIQYDFLVEQCLEPCKDRTLCENTLEIMLVDVSPGGQYAKFNSANNTSSENLSVLNTNNGLPSNVYGWGQANWRYPRLVINGQTYGVYLDEYGVRNKIKVFETTTPGVWSPKVNNPTLIETEAGTGDKFIYPENLLLLDDFINIWQDSYSKSLVMYHPEFAYYIACKDQSRVMAGDTISTEQVDSMLMASVSFSEAVQNGFIDSANSNRNLRVFDLSVDSASHAYDPFFSNPTAFDTFRGPFASNYTIRTGYSYNHVPDVAAMQLIMQNYITDGDSTYSMIEAAARAARCGGNFGQATDSFCLDFGRDLIPNPLSDPLIQQRNDSVRDMEWTNFKNYYIAEKRKLQYKRMNFFALHISNSADVAMPSSNFMGGCNACFGSTDFNSFVIGYYGVAANFNSNAPAWDASQPCSQVDWNRRKFAHSVKRFYDPENPGFDDSNAPYQVYQQTGQCPLAFELSNFLNQMAQNQLLNTSTNISLSSISSFGPSLYSSINSGAYVGYNCQVAIVGPVLSIKIIEPPSSVKASVKLSVTGTPITDFSRIISLQNLTYDSTTSSKDFFSVWATYIVDTTTGQTENYRIFGNSPISIHNCQFEPSCEPNDLANDYIGLLNIMLATGLAHDTVYNINADTIVSLFIGTSLKNTLGSPNDSLIWNYVSPDKVEIYDASNTSEKLIFTTLEFNPPAAETNTVGYGNIRSNYNNLFKMDALDTLGNKIADVSGNVLKVTGTDTLYLSMGSCGLPESPECSSTAHHVRNDLEKLLQECLTDTLAGSIDLYSKVNFSSLLQSYFTDTVTLSTSTHTFSLVDSTAYDTLKFNTSCTIELYHNISSPGSHAVNFIDLTSISNLTGVPPFDSENSFHDFYFLGTFYKDSTSYIDTVRGTSCMPLRNCKACAAPPSDISLRGCFKNEIADQTSLYLALLDSINLYNASPYAIYNNDTLLSPTFGLYISIPSGTNYTDILSELIHAPADTSLPKPVYIWTLSALKSDMCNNQYVNYANAVYNYNIFANTANFPIIDSLKNGECFGNYYCSCATSFIAGLTAIENGYPLIADLGIDTLGYTSFSQLLIDSACAEKYIVCEPSDTTRFEFPTIPYSPNPCVVEMVAAATQNGLNQYNQYVDSVTTSFVSRYNYHCLHPVENLLYTYTDKEYHFTLYYYDQAGNLVKTIPPEGVELLDIVSDSSLLEKQIKKDRLNNTQNVYTSHRMGTTYLYNSLNHLVRQDVPDHDKMDICESILPNGLDADLIINSMQFVSTTKGYLTGYLKRTISSTDLMRGYVYTTDNGGQNWKKLQGVAAGDMQKVQMVSSTVGYAVSSYGIVFKTLDGGYSWDALTNLYDSGTRYFSRLNDLCFTSTTNGIIGGIKGAGDGGVYQTTDGGATFTGATGFAAQDTITGLTYDGTNYYASVTNGGKGFVYTSSTGVAWTLSTSFTANTLKRVQYVNNDTAFAVGYDGTLLRSNSSNSIWTLIATNMPYAFSDVYFKNGSQGVAIVDSVAGKGRVYKTLNGGSTWEVLSAPGKYYSSLQLYDLTQSRVIAGGENGLVSKVLMNLPPFGMTPVSVPSITDDFNYTDAIFNSISNRLRTLAVSNSANIYLSYDPQADTWTSINSGVSTGFKKGLLSVNGSNYSPDVQALLCGNDGVLTGFYRPFNGTSSFSTITVTGAYFTDITCKNQNSTGVFYAFDTVSKTIYRLAFNSGTTASATATQLTGAISENLNSIALSRTGNSLVAVSNNGVIKYTSSVTGSSITWNDYSSTIVPLPLNDIAFSTSGNITAAGNDGTQWKSTDSGVSWKLTVNGIAAKLNAIKLKSTAAGLIAADGGKLYSVSNAMSISPTVTLFATGLTENLTDVAIQPSGNKAYVTTQGGKVLYLTNYTSSVILTSLVNNTNGGLNGVSFLTSGNNAYAVGNKAGAVLFAGNIGIKINDVYTHPLKSIHFYDNNKGYVVDSGYVIRHTINGGSTWNVVLPDTALPEIAKVHSATGTKALIVGKNEYVAQINNEAAPSAISVPGGIASDFKDIGFNANGKGVIVGSNGTAARINASGSTYAVTAIGSAGSGFSFNAVHVFNDSTNSFIAAGTGGNIRYYKTSFVQQNYGTASTDIFNDVYFHDDRTGYVVGNNGKAVKCMLSSNIFNAGSLGLTTDGIVWDNLCSSVYLDRVDSTVHFNTLAFSERNNGFLAGSNDSADYHRHALRLNDESNLYSTRFWYDKLGRMVVSQNTKQYNKVPKAFSYSKFDALGRIKEVGEKSENSTSTTFRKIFGTDVNGLFNSNTINDDSLSAWLAGSGARKEVTKTYYDTVVFNSLPLTQENLRKRVTGVTYEDVDDNIDSTYQHGTFYTYDIHGNVKSLVQDNRELYEEELALSSSLVDQRYKRIDYDYDLISGKVNSFRYQDGKPDAFYHFYSYDADNRITAVYTSRFPQSYGAITENTVVDNPLWDKDVRYWYYTHGPLARVEYGSNHVQGMDYAYTLQGWIKGVNSNTLDSKRDMGLDSYNDTVTSNPNKNFAKDGFGYTLNYFAGDYKAIDGLKWNNAADRFEAVTVGSDLEASSHDLYNGNIKGMVTTIVKPTITPGYTIQFVPLPQGTAFKYDQLNRLKEMKAWQNLNPSTNTWNSGLTYTGMYENKFSYDANGGLLTALAKNQAGTVIDNQIYQHQSIAGNRINNRIYAINDSATATSGNDLLDQVAFDNTAATINSANNYSFTEIGERKSNKKDSIDLITWTVYGKIKEVIRTSGSTKNNLKFEYDVSGNRIAKHVYTSDSTWISSEYYVRDAQGNIMSTYKKQIIDSTSTMSFAQTEKQIYGSSLVGIDETKTEMIGATIDTTNFTHVLGNRYYTGSNHLGNILVTFTDRKLSVDVDSNGVIDEYWPDVIASNDFAPFGGLLTERTFKKGAFPNSFNGKRDDAELDMQDYGLRMYSPMERVFPTIDPLTKEFPWYTPYQFAGNKPILATDLDGAEENPTNNGSDPNTTVSKPNTNPNSAGAPEKSIDDFTGEYGRDFGRAGDDAVRTAENSKFKGSNISYVGNTGALNGKMGEYMWEKNPSGNSSNPQFLGRNNNDMQLLPNIPAQLDVPVPPNMVFVGVAQPPIIQNINAGQINFNGGSTVILPGANPAIQRVANILTNNPATRVRVIGNALMGVGDTHNSMSNGPLTFGALKQGRANNVMGALLGLNPAFNGRISTRITPVGSNAQTIMFQVIRPNPQPMRWILAPAPAGE